MLQRTFEVDETITEDIPCGEVVTCIGEIDNKYIFIKNSRRGWELPTGRIEKGENPRKAAMREFFEETSVTAVDAEKVGKINWEDAADAQVTQHVFKITTRTGGQVTPGDDASETQLSTKPVKPASFGETGYKLFETLLDYV